MQQKTMQQKTMKRPTMKSPTIKSPTTTFTAQFILYIGGPGTGKSHKLLEISKQQPCHIFAPTWYCANKIGGQTIFNYCNCNFISFRPKKFQFETVLIDEIFMFDNKQMELFLQCSNENTNFIMFGDPFQLKSPSKNDFFYKAVAHLQVHQLDVYYRSKDQQLTDILKEYRLTHRMDPAALNLIKTLNKNQLPDLINQGFIIITSKYDRQQCLQDKINKSFKNLIFVAKDKNYYRVGQQAFLVNKYGSIQQKVVIIGSDKDDLIVEERGQNKQGTMRVQPYFTKNKYKYDLISGDVIIINLIQGQTIDKIILDYNYFFEFGSAYTAISRAKYLKNIYLYESPKKTFEADLDNEYCFMEAKV